MNIYFAGSIRGGRSYAPLYNQIINYLQQYGVVLTEHIGASKVHELEKNKSDVEIYEQDMNWLKQSDVVVADVSVPSLGVGYEIGYAASVGKKILCLYHKESTFTLSAMITGDGFIKHIEYRDFDDIKLIIKQYFSLTLKQH